MHLRLESRIYSPTHQIAHTDARKTYHTPYITVSLWMNPGVSKHVGGIRNEVSIYKIVHFVGLCCIIIMKAVSWVGMLKRSKWTERSILQSITTDTYWSHDKLLSDRLLAIRSAFFGSNAVSGLWFFLSCPQEWKMRAAVSKMDPMFHLFTANGRVLYNQFVRFHCCFIWCAS
jgi:hypothetical protein